MGCITCISFYPISSYMLPKYLVKLNYNNLICFRLFWAFTKCTITGDVKAHSLLMDAIEEGLHCCNIKPVESDKRLICIWTKTSLNQGECYSNYYSNPGSNTNRNCLDCHVLTDKLCCNCYCAITIMCRQNSDGQHKKECGLRMLRKDKCPHTFWLP